MLASAVLGCAIDFTTPLFYTDIVLRLPQSPWLGTCQVEKSIAREPRQDMSYTNGAPTIADHVCCEDRC